MFKKLFLLPRNVKNKIILKFCWYAVVFLWYAVVCCGMLQYAVVCFGMLWYLWYALVFAGMCKKVSPVHPSFEEKKSVNLILERCHMSFRHY